MTYSFVWDRCGEAVERRNLLWWRWEIKEKKRVMEVGVVMFFIYQRSIYYNTRVDA